jgi:hypothetical protein
MKRPTTKRKSRPWTNEDIKTLKTLVREKTKTTVVARKLKRTLTATRQKAVALGVKLAGSQRSKKRRTSTMLDPPRGRITRRAKAPPDPRSEKQKSELP